MTVSTIGSVLMLPPGEEVTLRGWVHRIRTSGKIAFIVLRDHTGLLQATVRKGGVPDIDFNAVGAASVESSIIVTGIVASDPRAPGGMEIRCTTFTLVGPADAFPITEYQSEELLLDNRHLWVRSRNMAAIMKIKATMLQGAREWLAAADFTEVTPPVLTQNVCEGGTTLFSLKYFDRQAYLSQSAQMYLEALCYSLGNVYSLTPSFRAEKSRTPRHLTEYWHLELEEAWIDNRGNMEVQEELVSAMVQAVLGSRRDELEMLGRDVEPLKDVMPPFPRMRYSQVLEDLKGRGFDIEFGDDLGAVEERATTQDRTVPVFVTNYPKQCKAFYMKEDADDPDTYACADLLAPEGYGEIIGGSERETDLDALLARMRAQDISLEPYQWYLDLRRYGSIPHSGFGMGIERMVRWVCGLEHIRDAMPFPRTINRIYP